MIRDESRTSSAGCQRGRPLSLSSEPSEPPLGSAPSPSLWKVSRRRRREAWWLTYPRTDSPTGGPGRVSPGAPAVTPGHLLLAPAGPSENAQSTGSAPRLPPAASIVTEMLSVLPGSLYTE